MDHKRNSEKQSCDYCIYHQDENFCLRKKEETKETDLCKHFVDVLSSHSLIKLMKSFANDSMVKIE